jgi:hypothetical protein
MVQRLPLIVLATAKVASKLCSTSAFVVTRDDTLIRIALRPFHGVERMHDLCQRKGLNPQLSGVG